MFILRKDKHIFIFTKYRLIMHQYKTPLKQTLLFSCIRITAFRHFDEFTEVLINSRPRQYDSFNEVISLATYYSLNIEGLASKPKEDLYLIRKHKVKEYEENYCIYW